jgi:uncharacterized protein (DUF1810 family)
MSLERFKQAQAASAGGFETALLELRAGRKTSHWIWHVFPQLAGLGRSATAQFYALRDLGEACDYLRDSVLGERLREAMAAVDAKLQEGVRLEDLMGGTIDSLKLVSSLTLFRAAARELKLPAFAGQCDAILAQAEQQGFPPCAFTLGRV